MRVRLRVYMRKHAKRGREMEDKKEGCNDRTKDNMRDRGRMGLMVRHKDRASVI